MKGVGKQYLGEKRKSRYRPDSFSGSMEHQILSVGLIMDEQEKFERKIGPYVFFILWFWLALFPPTWLPWSTTVLKDKAHGGWYFLAWLRQQGDDSTIAGYEGIDWGWTVICSIGFALFGLIILAGKWIWPEEKHKFSEKNLNEIMAKYGIKSRRKFVRTFTGFDTDEYQYMKRSEIEKAAQAFMGIEDE